MHDNINIAVGGPINADYPKVYKTKFLKPGIPVSIQVTEPNTKYVIKYNFDLDGGTVTIPEGCLLEFDGGSISNGTIEFDNTILIYNQQEEDVLKNITMVGDYEVSAGGKGDKKDNINGMGKIYLKKNKGFAEQLTQENTIYVIQYDFDLDEEEVTIPDNCVLEFDGGNLSNGTLQGNYTYIQARSSIFSNIKLEGIWKECDARLSWWNLIDNVANDEFASLLTCFDNIYIDKDCILNHSIPAKSGKSIHIHGNGSTVYITGIDGASSMFNFAEADKLEIDNIKFDFLKHCFVSDGEKHAVRIQKDVKDVSIHDVSFVNYGDLNEIQSESNFACVFIVSVKGNILSVVNVTFSDLFAVGSVPVSDNTGVITGICITDYVNGEHVGGGLGYINNCIFNNIYTINSEGNIIIDDGRAIYINYYIDAAEKNKSSITIQGCSFYNINKDCIKAQVDYLYLLDNYAINKLDGSVIDSFINYQGDNLFINGLYADFNGPIIKTAYGNNLYVESCFLNSNGSYIFQSSASNVSIDNCMLESTYQIYRPSNDAYGVIDYKADTIRFTNCRIEAPIIVFVIDGFTRNYTAQYESCIVDGNSFGKDFSFRNSQVLIDDRITILKAAFENCKLIIKKVALADILIAVGNGYSLIMNNVHIKALTTCDLDKAVIACYGKASIVRLIVDDNITLSLNGIIDCSSNTNIYMEDIDGRGSRLKINGTAVLCRLKNFVKIDAFSSSNITTRFCQWTDSTPYSTLKNYITSRSSIIAVSSTDRPTSLGNTVSDKGFSIYDMTLNKPLWWSGTKWLESDGAKAGVNRSGTFANKPASTDIYIGFQYFNTESHKMITWNGTKWYNPDGTEANV